MFTPHDGIGTLNPRDLLMVKKNVLLIIKNAHQVTTDLE